MAQMASDRNLLFGILALQMDFISRDALIAAMNAWLLQKHRSLGEILEEQGILSPADRSLLEPLVRRHIEQHGDDPAQSLASLSSVEWIRGALAAVERADPEVRGSLDRLGAGPSRSVIDPHGTITDHGTGESAGPRFRILRFHAKGGLGEVFVAEDAELHRQVALKRIQDRHGDQPESRSRFLLEAEITGGLEHPGIVPVYGLGHYDDGRPFYAMRFIKGDSLKEAIARFHGGGAVDGVAGERMLGLQKLLRRFLDVCNAVAYAHSRGVLHRDIKPGNIMVGQYGETLVVDWGLAKLVGTTETSDEATLRPPSASGTGETLPGSAIGTPAFMSPEQAEGRIDRLGPASDVYSLGATLYSLLTGRPPVGGSDLEEILRCVRQGEIVPPRQVAPEVPRALEAICLKAMAREPEGRYPTPRALADDIERWMADEPVSAWREPFSVRTRRWMRRHKTAVATTAATLLVGVVALGIAYSRESAINRQLKLANLRVNEKNQELEAANAKLVDANQRVREQADLARRNGETAQANFRLAFDAVDRSFTQVSESQLLNVPGLQPLRRQLLDTSRDFYQKFLDRRRDDPSVQAELARAYIRLADIAFNTDTTPKAIELAQEARKRFEALERSDPANLEYARELARVTAAIGYMYTWSRRLDLAEPEYQAAIHLYEGLLTKHPADAHLLGGLAKARGDLGMHYVMADRPADARPVLLAARAAAKDLVAAHPDDTMPWGVLHSVEFHLVQHFTQVGDLAAADAASHTALDAIERMLRKRPENLQWQYFRASELMSQGEVYRELSRMEDAERSFQESAATLDKLVRENPGVSLYRRALSRVHVNRGMVALAVGRREQAELHYNTALKIAEELARENPEVPDIQNEVAVALSGLFEVYQGSGRTEPAMAVSRRAVEIRRALARDHSQVGLFQTALTESLNKQAQASRGTASPSLAGPQGIESLRKLVREHPELVKYRTELATSLNTQANLAMRAHQWDQSEAAFRESIAAWREVAKIQPNVPDVRYKLGMTVSNYAGMLTLRRAFDRASPILREASELLEQLVRERPEIIGFAQSLSAAYDMQGSVAREKDDLAAAAEWYKRAIEILDRLLARDPQNAVAKQFLITSHNNHAVLLIKRGDHRGAVRELEPLTRDPVRRAHQVYNLGCAFSLASAGAAADAKLAKAERDSLVESLAVRAVKLLGEATTAGFLSPTALLAQMKSDTDLDPLRARGDFRRLLDELWDRAFPADPFAR